MTPIRLAIVATHPVQYQAPWFAGLASCEGLEVTVYYGHHPTPAEQAAGFDVPFEWDRPLLDGYRSAFLRNVARRPSLTRFLGVDTPELSTRLVRAAHDAVLVMGWHFLAAWQAFHACRRAGLPVLVRSDSHLRTPRSWLTRGVKRLVYPRFIRRLDACLAVGTWSRDYFLRYGAAPGDVFVVPHSVDPALWKMASTPARLDARRRFGLSEEAFVVLFAGKLSAVKRPLDAIAAAGQAAQKGARIELLIAGDGPLRAACEQAAAASRAPVRFAGFLNQTQMQQAYDAADVVVVPSAETWGLVVNEAMTCGRPCVVSDAVGSWPDLVEPGATGEVFRWGDVAELGVKLAVLAGEPGRARSLGGRARQRIAAFSPERATASLQAALAQVVS
jgi:glycosyltransferase involved in cell wall biosynthesis